MAELKQIDPTIGTSVYDIPRLPNLSELGRLQKEEDTGDINLEWAEGKIRERLQKVQKFSKHDDTSLLWNMSPDSEAYKQILSDIREQKIYQQEEAGTLGQGIQKPDLPNYYTTENDLNEWVRDNLLNLVPEQFHGNIMQVADDIRINEFNVLFHEQNMELDKKRDSNIVLATQGAHRAAFSSAITAADDAAIKASNLRYELELLETSATEENDNAEAILQKKEDIERQDLIERNQRGVSVKELNTAMDSAARAYNAGTISESDFNDQVTKDVREFEEDMLLSQGNILYETESYRAEMAIQAESYVRTGSYMHPLAASAAAAVDITGIRDTLNELAMNFDVLMPADMANYGHNPESGAAYVEQIMGRMEGERAGLLKQFNLESNNKRTSHWILAADVMKRTLDNDNVMSDADKELMLLGLDRLNEEAASQIINIDDAERLRTMYSTAIRNGAGDDEYPDDVLIALDREANIQVMDALQKGVSWDGLMSALADVHINKILPSGDMKRYDMTIETYLRHAGDYDSTIFYKDLYQSLSSALGKTDNVVRRELLYDAAKNIAERARGGTLRADYMGQTFALELLRIETQAPSNKEERRGDQMYINDINNTGSVISDQSMQKAWLRDGDGYDHTWLQGVKTPEGATFPDHPKLFTDSHEAAGVSDEMNAIIVDSISPYLDQRMQLLGREGQYILAVSSGQALDIMVGDTLTNGMVFELYEKSFVRNPDTLEKDDPDNPQLNYMGGTKEGRSTKYFWHKTPHGYDWQVINVTVGPDGTFHSGTVSKSFDARVDMNAEIRSVITEGGGNLLAPNATQQNINDMMWFINDVAHKHEPLPPGISPAMVEGIDIYKPLPTNEELAAHFLGAFAQPKTVIESTKEGFIAASHKPEQQRVMAAGMPAYQFIQLEREGTFILPYDRVTVDSKGKKDRWRHPENPGASIVIIDPEIAGMVAEVYNEGGKANYREAMEFWEGILSGEVPGVPENFDYYIYQGELQ